MKVRIKSGEEQDGEMRSGEGDDGSWGEMEGRSEGEKE